MCIRDRLDGELAGYGGEGCGKLTLQAERVRIVTRKQPGNCLLYTSRCV